MLSQGEELLWVLKAVRGHVGMERCHEAIPAHGTARHLSHGNYPLDKSARAALAQTVW